MNDNNKAGRPAPPSPDPRIGDPVARRLLELGLMQESMFTPGGDVPTPEELNELLPEYEIEGLIGKGGMGAVYRARQKSLDRAVALKVLIEPKTDAGFAERFQREAQTLASLSHPGIVAVYDFGRAGEHWYLTMELIEGTDLRRVIDGRAITPREALGIVSQVCEALQFAHDKGVVHRDIKPGNVLLDADGHVKITDFGLAKMLGVRPAPALTRATQVMGTPNYMAPEQWETPLEVDHRADIYSLGVVLYELLTGELPMGNFALPSQRVQVDVRLDDVVLRALQKELPKRYQSAADVRTDVDDVVAHPERQPVSGRRNGALILAWSAAAGFALLAVLAGTGTIPALFPANTGQAAEQAAGSAGDPAPSPPPAVEMRDLLVEENGRFVSKTVEFDAAGVPHVSQHFASVFDMDEGNIAQANGYLRTQRQAYLELETAKSSVAWAWKSESVTITIGDFAHDGNALIEHTMALLEGTLGDHEIPEAAVMEIQKALFPMTSGGRLTLSLSGSEPLLQVDGTRWGSLELRGERIQREYGHLLVDLTHPPTSPLSTARAVITALEGYDWGPNEMTVVECHGNEVWKTERGEDNRPFRRILQRRELPCRVSLDIYLRPLAGVSEGEEQVPDGSSPEEGFTMWTQNGELQPLLSAYLQGQKGFDLQQVELSVSNRGPGKAGVLGVRIMANSSGTRGVLHAGDFDLEQPATAQELTATLKACGFDGEFEGLYSSEVAPLCFSQQVTEFDYSNPELTLQRSTKELLACLERSSLAAGMGTVINFNIRPYNYRRNEFSGIKANLEVVNRKAWPARAADR